MEINFGGKKIEPDLVFREMAWAGRRSCETIQLLLFSFFFSPKKKRFEPEIAELPPNAEQKLQEAQTRQ
jgi:hypothetical protein